MKDNVNKRKLRLDLACGKRKKHNFIGVDLWEGADIVYNLEKFPWPFENDSVDEIFCQHYIEHVPDFVSFANELHRIMKVGAKAEIIAPYYTSVRAWMDPTHIRAISEGSFQYLSKKWRESQGLDHYPITADFEYVYRYGLDSNWKDKSAEELDFAITHYFNVVHDIEVVLTKIKPLNMQAANLTAEATKCWDRGHRKKAFALAQQSLNIDQTFDALMIAGEYELMYDNCVNAIRHFRDAINLYPDSCEAHAGLVRSYIGSGRRGVAQRHAARLVLRLPEIAGLLETYLGI
jgi:predicted SAM-dependent methyltransferase